MISHTLRDQIKESLPIVSYEKIVLFGSRARDDYNEHSDFDLLIILKSETPKNKKISLSTQIRKCLATKMIDADVLVKDNTDINYLKDKTGSVVRNALLEGIQL